MEQKRNKNWLVKTNKINTYIHSPKQSNGFHVAQIKLSHQKQNNQQQSKENNVEPHFINSKNDNNIPNMTKPHKRNHKPGISSDKLRYKKEKNFLKEAEDIILNLIEKNTKKGKDTKKIQSAVLKEGYEATKLTLQNSL